MATSPSTTPSVSVGASRVTAMPWSASRSETPAMNSPASASAMTTLSRSAISSPTEPVRPRASARAAGSGPL